MAPSARQRPPHSAPGMLTTPTASTVRQTAPCNDTPQLAGGAYRTGRARLRGRRGAGMTRGGGVRLSLIVIGPCRYDTSPRFA